MNTTHVVVVINIYVACTKKRPLQQSLHTFFSYFLHKISYTTSEKKVENDYLCILLHSVSPHFAKFALVESFSTFFSHLGPFFSYMLHKILFMNTVVYRTRSSMIQLAILPSRISACCRKTILRDTLAIH